MKKSLACNVLESVKKSRRGLKETYTSQNVFSSPAKGKITISLYKASDIENPETDLPNYEKTLKFPDGTSFEPVEIEVELSEEQAKNESFVQKTLQIVANIYPHRAEDNDTDFFKKVNPIPRSNDRAYYYVDGETIRCIEFSSDYKMSDLLSIKAVIADPEKAGKEGIVDFDDEGDFDLGDLEADLD